MITTNCNPKTGISYGVASLNSLQDWVFDEFYESGTNLSWDAAEREFFKLQGNFDEDTPAWHEFAENYQSDEDTYELETDGLKLGLSTLGGAYLVWVFESPHTCDCRPCSPCVPGAGDLDSGRTEGNTTYDLPAEWYVEPLKQTG